MTKPRKKYRPRGARADAITLAIMGQCKLSPKDQEERSAPLRVAVDAIASGVATQADWQAVFDVVNMLDRFVTMPRVMRGGQDYLESIQAVIVGILDRQKKTGSKALYPGELADLRGLVDLWKEVLSVVTHREFFEAEEKSHKRLVSVIRGGGAVVVSP